MDRSPRRKRRTPAAAAALALLAGACGGPADAPGGGPEDAPAEEEEARLTPPTPAELPGLAERGSSLFQEKGCVGCHVIGGEPTSAPDLAGVTERRSYAWIVQMITAPDSMTRDDPEARALLGRYLVQMPALQVSEDEARALYAHLQRPSPQG